MTTTEQHSLMRDVIAPIREKIQGFIVGQDEPVFRIILSLLAVGQSNIKNVVTGQPFFGCAHILFIGSTGTAKTILCQMLAALIDGKFKMVRGTSDMLASDITGFEMISLRPQDEILQFRQGPVFANILLFDEINRPPPKAISGVLEAMAEGTITCMDKTYALPEPFLCLATMNPSEQSGTSELNEAVSDRFIFCELMDEPTEDQLVLISNRLDELRRMNLKPIAGLEAINRLRCLIAENVYISEEVRRYCARVIKAVNHPRKLNLFERERKLLGGGRMFRQSQPLSPRAMAFLCGTAKARAAVDYRDYVTVGDVRDILPSVLRSRLSLVTEGAQFQLVDEDGDAPYLDKQSLVTGLINQILEKVPVV